MAFSPGDREAIRGWRRWVATVCWLTGLLAGVAGWFVFTRVHFGVWWINPLILIDDPALHQALDGHFMGLARPRLSNAFALLAGRGVGLLVNFPWVWVMLAGLAVILTRRRSATRPDAILALAVFAGMVLLGSARVIAWEGLGYGPRHLLGVLVFIWIGLTPWLVTHRRLIVAGVMTLGLACVALNLLYLASDISAPGVVTERMIAALPALPTGVDGPIFAIFQQGAAGRLIESNWGTELGLHGVASLAPLAGLWGLFWAWLIFGMKKPVYPRSPDLIKSTMTRAGPSPSPRRPVVYEEPPDIHEHPHRGH